MVRNLLIWISGVAFVLAGAVAAVAITSTGSATAQTADDTTTAVRTADPKSDAADTFAGVADDVLDRLVAADVITEDDADGARTYLDEARTKFDAIDWDKVRQQATDHFERFRRQLSGADWDAIVGQLRDAIADADLDVEGLDDFDPDTIDWDSYRDMFERFQTELESFNLDEAIARFERELDRVDWDDVRDRIERQLDDVDWNDLRNQLEDALDR